MIRDRKLVALPDDEGKRLDAFLVESLATSRALVAEAIDRKWLTLNGRPSKKGARLKAGDEVEIRQLRETEDWKAFPNAEIAIPVVHEEKEFLVIDKPAGLPVHPLTPEDTATVVSGLLAKYPELEGIGPDPLFPAVAHRLDTETSGVMLVARTPETYENFRRQFAEGQVEKKYVAVVQGVVTGRGRLENFLAHSGGRRGAGKVVRRTEDGKRKTEDSGHRMKVVDTPTDEAMRAVTEYEIRKTEDRAWKNTTVLHVTIRTGVTHQIRCQLAHIGHAVVGDRLYGSRSQTGRLMLHAEEIRFKDPVAGNRRTFRAEPPEDLTAPGLRPATT